MEKGFFQRRGREAGEGGKRRTEEGREKSKVGPEIQRRKTTPLRWLMEG